MNKRSGLVILSALALLLSAIIDVASYTTALVTARGTLKITASSDALLGVPTFSELSPLAVPRGQTGALTFHVEPRMPGNVTLSFAEFSAPNDLQCTYTANTSEQNCTLTVSPNQGLSPGVYLVQAVVTGEGEGVRATVNVSIPVSVVFGLPEAQDDQVETPVGIPVEISVTGNDNGDGDPTAVVQMVGDPNHGFAEVCPDRRSIIYTPPDDWNGTATFRYKLQNSSGSDTATVTVKVVDP